MFRTTLELEATRVLQSEHKDELFHQPAYLICTKGLANPRQERREHRREVSGLQIKSEVVTWGSLENKARECSIFNTYIQRYIAPHKGRKVLYRLNYFCDQGHDRRANFVEIIGNKTQPSPFENLGIWNYVNFDGEILGTCYHGFKELEATAARLVHLIKIEFRMRLTKIVLNFIKETKAEPRFWLIGLHSFCLQSHIPEPIPVKNAIAVSERTTPIKCSLCGEKFKRGEIQKTLPLKMLVDTKNHMERRRISGLFPQAKEPMPLSLIHPTRICTLCYLLALQEKKLAEIEIQMAKAQNIPVSELGIYPKHLQLLKDEDPDLLLRPKLFSNTLIQWRILFFPLFFTDFDIEAILPSRDYSLDFSIFPHIHTQFSVNFSKMSLKDKKLSIMRRQKTEYLSPVRYKFSGNLVAEKNSEKSRVNTQLISTRIPINKIRIHYFFSESKNIGDFLEVLEADLKLVNPDRQMVGQAKCKILKDFVIDKNNGINAEKCFKRIVLYSPLLQVMHLEAIVGICCDGELPVAGTKLTKYHNLDVNNIFRMGGGKDVRMISCAILDFPCGFNMK